MTNPLDDMPPPGPHGLNWHKGHARTARLEEALTLALRYLGCGGLGTSDEHAAMACVRDSLEDPKCMDIITGGLARASLGESHGDIWSANRVDGSVKPAIYGPPTTGGPNG